MGDEADGILASLSVTDEEIQAYGTVKGKLDSYFTENRNVIYEKVKFNQRKQRKLKSGKLSIVSSRHSISFGRTLWLRGVMRRSCDEQIGCRNKRRTIVCKTT